MNFKSLIPVLILLSGLIGFAGYAYTGFMNKQYRVKNGQLTEPSTLDLVPTFQSISVYASFAGDNNANNQAQLSYRPTGTTTWIQGMSLTVDRRATITSDVYLFPNPYINQWRGSLIGLRPNTSYDVQVTFTDPDGVSGTATLNQTVRTMDDRFPSNGGNYYVAPTGSDSNPGSLEKPFKTIQRGVTELKAGETLNIRAGTYTERVVIEHLMGKSDNWITIQAYPGETPSIDGQNKQPENLLIGGSSDPKTQFVRIKGLHLTDAQTAITINDRAANIVIDGNRLDGFVDNGIYVGLWNTPNTPTSRVVIQNNSIVRNKLPGANGGTNIGLYSNGGGNIIRNNVIKDITGNISGQNDASHLDCIGGGPDFQMDTGLYRDTDVYNNTISDCNDDAIQADGSAMNVRIWGNTLWGIKTNNSGISTAPTIVGPIYIFRNLVIGQLTDALKQGQNSTGAEYIYHNTFYTTRPTADGFFQTNPGLENVTALNNILQVGRYVVEYSDENKKTGLTFDYNNLRSWDPTWFFFLDGENYDFATLQAKGFEKHGLNIDATDEFVDAAQGDYRLKMNSQLVDKGVIIQGFNDPASPWAYRGKAPDLGAYELQSSPADAPSAGRWQPVR